MQTGARPTVRGPFGRWEGRFGSQWRTIESLLGGMRGVGSLGVESIRVNPSAHLVLPLVDRRNSKLVLREGVGQLEGRFLEPIFHSL